MSVGGAAGWRAVRGAISQIQPYSIHDGPGIRTTIFFQGCPLACWWCHNPEAKLARRQLLFDADRCQGCGACVPACPSQAIGVVQGRAVTDRARCDGTGACVAVCPNEARSIVGRHVTAGETFDEAAVDAMFFSEQDGGITLSGGEPLSQPDFAAALLYLCDEAGIHATVDTCGQAPWPTLARVLPLAKLVLFDLKHMNSDAHLAATGVRNEWILENARRVHRELQVPLRVRVPVIPGMNDTDDNIAATARFVAEELSPLVPLHLIPYHAFGEGKRAMLGGTATQETHVPSAERMGTLQALAAGFGLEVLVGG